MITDNLVTLNDIKMLKQQYKDKQCCLRTKLYEH